MDAADGWIEELDLQCDNSDCWPLKLSTRHSTTACSKNISNMLEHEMDLFVSIVMQIILTV